MQMWIDGFFLFGFFFHYKMKLQGRSKVCMCVCVSVCLFRIVVVKQTRDVLSPLNNATLVDVVMRSILPSSHHLLSAKEVADAIETRLQTREDDIWTSWTVRHAYTKCAEHNSVCNKVLLKCFCIFLWQTSLNKNV